MDLFDVMVHLFLPDMRRRYRLEHLWREVPEVSVPRLLGEPEPVPAPVVPAAGPKKKAPAKRKAAPKKTAKAAKKKPAAKKKAPAKKKPAAKKRK